MRGIVNLIILSQILVGCAERLDKPERASNIFYINGRTIEVTDSLLKEIRASWKDSNTLHGPTKVPVKDQQWTMDFISISQIISPEKCKNLRLVSIGTYQGGYESPMSIDSGDIGNFNELWSINACERPAYYRVLHNRKLNNIEISRVYEQGL